MRRYLYVLCFLIGVLALSYSSATSPTPVLAQLNCTNYNQCERLQSVASTKVQGPITYWFDDDRIIPFLSLADMTDFKNRLRAAAQDWSVKTGISISEVTSGGRVRIVVSGLLSIQNVNAEVMHDQSFPNVVRMTFSNEWPQWDSAGKDWIASHEWGHIIGFDDVAEDACLSVETIMRQGSRDTETFDRQLKGLTPLPGPGRPNGCDVCAAQDKQAGLVLGTSCPTPTPTPEQPGCEPRPSGMPPAPRECFVPAVPCDPITQEWDEMWCMCVCRLSPVLIDVAGDGFSLTDAAAGVNFDLDADGLAERLSWTATGTDDAWLALDRNGNGTIDDGRELFGNFTPQPVSATSNGFLALAVYDSPAHGGNADGVIDARDTIFHSLRLWQDTNHDGHSQVEELHTLENLEVTALHLDHKESKRIDEHGNAFRYRAKVDDAKGSKVGRWAWDVFLVSGR
ncbi:MAG TPA: hypothetical protein VGV59_09525 [Pyrinomonadaceae bacterium]|nr:hypothetical protein [Pyrinomonadaceae bacterium]